jgi:Peptidase S24-like
MITRRGEGRTRMGGMRRWDVVVVRGRSMLPTLKDGDLLLVRSGSGRRAGTGRLAVVRLPGGRPVSVKRLGARDADGWWVERDNPVEGVDSWQLGVPVPDADVLGVVAARIWPPPFRLAPESAHLRPPPDPPSAPRRDGG